MSTENTFTALLKNLPNKISLKVKKKIQENKENKINEWKEKNLRQAKKGH